MTAVPFQRKDFVVAAGEAWGEAAPMWVQLLAQCATNNGIASTAKRIGYSPSALSHVLSKSYAGDLTRIEKAVRGALMNEEVECPVVGPMNLARCLSEQRRSDTGTSAARTSIYQACRGIGRPKCRHSLLGDGER